MKSYPMNGPTLKDQETATYYWIKPQEAARLRKEWSKRR